MTEEEIIKGRVQGNERAVLVVIGIANTMGKLLPLGMATVWQTLESLKKEILTKREQRKSSLVSASNTVQDEMQEIAFSICLENLSVFPLKEAETPYLRVLSLASETGININILHNAFYAALQQYVSEQASKIRSMNNRQKQM